MPETSLNLIADAGVLRAVASGLMIVRRFKHEWQDRLSRASADEIASMTDKVNGSKFLPSWPLQRQVDWTDDFLRRNGWIPGQTRAERMRLAEDVGLVSGKRVHTICVRSDGRRVHAYPDKDE